MNFLLTSTIFKIQEYKRFLNGIYYNSHATWIKKSGALNLFNQRAGTWQFYETGIGTIKLSNGKDGMYWRIRRHSSYHVPLDRVRCKPNQMLYKRNELHTRFCFMYFFGWYGMATVSLGAPSHSSLRFTWIFIIIIIAVWKSYYSSLLRFLFMESKPFLFIS